MIIGQSGCWLHFPRHNFIAFSCENCLSVVAYSVVLSRQRHVGLPANPGTPQATRLSARDSEWDSHLN